MALGALALLEFERIVVDGMNVKVWKLGRTIYLYSGTCLSNHIVCILLASYLCLLSYMATG